MQAAWEDMNAKIKGAFVTETSMVRGKAKVVEGKKGEDEEEWVDEDESEKMVEEEEEGIKITEQVGDRRNATNTALGGVT